MKLAIFVATAALAGLCAMSAFGQNASGGSVQAASSQVGHIPPPPPGKSQVVFFRTGAAAGAATWFKVREDGAELGKLSNQSYFIAILEPGTHVFTSTTETKTKLKLELDDGETYYVRGTWQMGVFLSEVSLAPADQAMFELHYDHMHMVKFQLGDAPTPPDKPAS